MAEENKEELELVEVENEDSNENINETTEESDIELPDSENQDFAKKKKTNKLKLVLFGVIGFLVLILITGIILFATGFFDEEPVKEMQKSQVQSKVKDTQNNIQEENQEYKFSLNDVNTNNLNKELLKLTNKSINEKKEEAEKEELENEKKILEEEKKKYKEKLAAEEKKLTEEKALLDSKKEQLQKQKKELESLKKQANSLKEEMLREKEILEVEREKLILAQMEIENTIKQEENKIEIQKEIETTSNIKTSNRSNEKVINTKTIEEKVEMDAVSFIKLINVAKIKGELYKNYLDKVLSVHNDILLCRDDFNNIEIYFGPFEENMKRKDVYNKLQDNGFKDSYEVELTKEEFNKRCNY